MNTLYDIQGEYLTLLSYADEIEDPKLFLDTLESIQGELEVKADNYGIVIAEMNSAVKKYEAEIERLKPLIALGGYIPCPDHRIPPDAKYELVAYYCELFRKAF